MARLKAAGLAILEFALGELDELASGTAFYEVSQKFDFCGDTPFTVVGVQTGPQRLPKELLISPYGFCLQLLSSSIAL